MKAFDLEWMRQRQTDRGMCLVADLTITLAAPLQWLVAGNKGRESDADDSVDVTGCRVGTT